MSSSWHVVVVVVMAVAGVALIAVGVREWRLGRGVSAAPERISLKQLIARGPEGNPNIILTEFELCDNYVCETKHGAWTGVYVPVVPADEASPVPKALRHTIEPGAVLFSRNVHREGDIVTVFGEPELPALVTNRVRSLGPGEVRLLRDAYPWMDAEHCLIIEEGKTPMSGGFVGLMVGGGALLLLGALGVTGLQIVRSWKSVVERAAAQRRRRLQGEGEGDPCLPGSRPRHENDE
jgi:hypothetical protein